MQTIETLARELSGALARYRPAPAAKPSRKLLTKAQRRQNKLDCQRRCQQRLRDSRHKRGLTSGGTKPLTNWGKLMVKARFKQIAKANRISLGAAQMRYYRKASQ